MDMEDDAGWDGPNIRPPQLAAARPSGGGGSNRHHGGGRDRFHGRDRGNRGQRGGGGRDRHHDRVQSKHVRREEQQRRRQSGGEDLRDRLNRGGGTDTRRPSRRDRDRDRDNSRGSRRVGHHRSVSLQQPQQQLSEQEVRAREEKEQRLQKLMAANSQKVESRRDVEVRRQRREMEKQAQEAEKRVKRKRERSLDKQDGSGKRHRDKSSDDFEDDEEDDDEEEGAELVSGEDVSGSDVSGEEEEDVGEEEESEGEEEDSDTASERSGATPDHHDDDYDDDEEYERSPGDEKVKRRKDDNEDEDDEENIAKGKWRQDSESSPARGHGEVSRTPSRSPTPRRLSDHDSVEPVDERATPLSQQGSFQEEVPTTAEKDAEAQQQQASNPPELGKTPDKDERDDLPLYLPSVHGCRSVEEFHCLNRIEEGTYGVVYRARDKKTNEIVALKKLKMEREKEGFPITSLREINTLLISQHRNVVHVREIVVGSDMDKIFIVMDFVEHDLKSLMETMREKKQVFLPGEVKCLMMQLLSAIAHLHDNWILHRDLKTSNLLLSHNGILKVGDFGLAREYGSPLKQYTAIVVTLWYRAPELLLGIKEYSTFIDAWSIGCIFGEFLLMDPLFPGKSDIDQLNRIFKLLGTPSEKIWPGYNKLPAVQKMKFVDFPISHIRNKFPLEMLSEKGLGLLKKFLTYDPKQRITCEQAIRDSYFDESPLAIDPSMFPTWPAKSELSASQKSKKAASPKPPSGGGAFKKINDDEDERRLGAGFSFNVRNNPPVAAGWNLKF